MPRFFDGAFGTYYYKLTNNHISCENANINDKDTVLSIHKEYISAGVNYIKTNTYNANLPTYGDINTVRDIICAGYELAQQAVKGTDAAVFADIGYIDSDNPDAYEQYSQIAEMFIGLGATHYLFETLCEYDVIAPAVKLIKSKVKDAVVLVSFAISQDGYTRKGLYYKTLLSCAADDIHVDIVGLNCACGPTHLLNLIKDLHPLQKPLSVMPNSGYPVSINGRTVFEDNAEYFAGKINELYNEGAAYLGGCCGTTPKHMELSIKRIGKQPDKVKTQKKDDPITVNIIKERLAAKRISVELDPPKNCDCGYILNAADKLKECGVEIITFADSPLAKARADSIMTAAKVKQEKNIDVLPHLTCRDKNHIAIKAALLGAGFNGINKILAVTGDPVVFDSYKKSGVFNFNSIELIAYINDLNKELFQGREFSIGGALNINAANFESEIKRCRKKIDNGASFLYSQPIFSSVAIENFKEAKRRLDCEIHAGILPVASYKNAVFLQNEVSGIEIPEEVIAELADKPKAEVYDISIGFSGDIIKAVYDYADGFYIMTPLRKIDLVCGLISGCFDV